MRHSYLFSSVLLFTVVLSGCSQPMVKGWDTRSIKELEKGASVLGYVNMAVPTSTGAIENYSAYLEDKENTLYHAGALKRLAELELEETETAASQTVVRHTEASEKALLRSINHYNDYLRLYPDKQDNDFVLYQLAKAYDFNGETEQSLLTLDKIVQRYPESSRIDEIQFRRGEILFVFSDYANAEKAYAAVANKAEESKYKEKARYKLAWSQFKQTKYIKALGNCFTLLDNKHAQNKLGEYAVAENVERAEKDFINDIIRLVNLSLTYKDDAKTIQQIFAGRENRQYEPLLYRQLGEFYMKNERAVEAAHVYLDYGIFHPDSLKGADFHILAMGAYKKSDLPELLLASRISFVKKYGVESSFWKKHKRSEKKQVVVELKSSIKELSRYYHAVALKTGKSADYMNAAVWYKTYIRSFPRDDETPMMNFLLAESLYDAKKYRNALNEYVRTAYNYRAHSKSAEAGYAAILTYNLLIKNTSNQDRSYLEGKALKNAIRFSTKFKNSKYAPAVIAKSAEKLYANKDYTGVIDFSSKNEHLKNLDDKSHFKATWLVYAHSLFEVKKYAPAEEAYKKIRMLMSEKGGEL